MTNEDPFQSAMAYHQNGLFERAEQMYRGIVEAAPNNAPAWHYLGLLLHHTGRSDEGAALIGKSLEIDPGSTEALCNLGMLQKALGRTEDAVASYREALRLNAANAIAQHNLGNALQSLERWPEAQAAYDAAIRIDPFQVDSLVGLGESLFAQAKLAPSATAFAAAVKRDPTRADARLGWGRALLEQMRLDEAEEQFRTVLQNGPNADALFSLGIACYYRGDLTNAIRCFRQTLELSPDFSNGHFHLAAALLRNGEFAEGWAEYEWRRRLPGFQGISDTSHEWHGEPLEGRTLLLYGEQGLGDSLQFAALVPMLAARGDRVVLAVPAPLVRLLRATPGVSEVVAHGQPISCDLHLPLLSLPHVLGVGLDVTPSAAPYLRADDEAVAVWRGRLAEAGGLKIGLAWAGNPRSHDPRATVADRRRSLRLEQLAPLAAFGGVTWVSLQKGEPAMQTRGAAADLPLLDLMDKVEDFADTAALVANLDLVITVDTSIAHLAGGMGKPVWILSRYDGCWRWLSGRDDVPWYPSAWLFHQRTPGDWAEVIDRVAQMLQSIFDPSAVPPDDTARLIIPG